MSYNQITQIDNILVAMNNKIKCSDHQNLFTINELHTIGCVLTGLNTKTIQVMLAKMCEMFGYIKYDMIGIFYITDKGFARIKQLETEPEQQPKEKRKQSFLGEDGFSRY